MTVYDFIYEYFRSGLAGFVHSYQKARALKNADGIVCISENTKKDLLKFYPLVDEKKVRVIHCGVGDNFAPCPKDTLNDGVLQKWLETKYVLYVGGRSGYKNFITALQALSQLPDCALLIAGGGALSDEEKKMLSDKLRNRYHHVSTVDDRTLNILYSNAFCLLYPSSYEGFGIPLVEAMKCGCPVVTTNTSSIPEVVGDAGLMVDRIGKDSFVQKLKKLEDIAFRTDIIERGYRQARRFSWDKCYQETLAFYEQTIKAKAGSTATTNK